MSILHPSSKKISFLLHQLGRAVEQTHTHQITLKFKNFSADVGSPLTSMTLLTLSSQLSFQYYARFPSH